jgi:hypothetical protein
MKNRPLRVVEQLPDLLDSVLAQRANAADVQLAALVLQEARSLAAGRVLCSWSDSVANDEARPISRRRLRRIEVVARIGLGRAADRLHPARRERFAVVRQREEARVHAAHQAVERRGGDGVVQQIVQGGFVRAAIDFNAELHRQRAPGHGAARERTLHRVIVVLGEADVANGDAARLRQREDLVQGGGDHAHREERERTGRGIGAVEVGPFVACQPPDIAGAAGGDQRLLLKLRTGQCTHPSAQ